MKRQMVARTSPPAKTARRRRFSLSRLRDRLRVSELSDKELRRELVIRGLSGRTEHFLKGKGLPRLDVAITLADILCCKVDDFCEEVKS